MKPDARLLLIAGALIAAPAAAHAACAGAGVITRIEGDPQNVTITRDGRPVARPRVLEVVCDGDQISTGGGAAVSLSLDGGGKARVQGQPYRVSRAGQTSMAGNAYREISDRMSPDMKRMPWDVRLKGDEPPFGFAVTGLAGSGQKVRAGDRPLLVRVAGGVGPYTVHVEGPGGSGQGQGSDTNVMVGGVSLRPGAYRLHAMDSAGHTVDGGFTVVNDAPPAGDAGQGLPDPEVSAAVRALAMAKAAPNAWAFEAEQTLASAPAAGLDRARVYQLLESYDGE